MAPDAQAHIASFMWFGTIIKKDIDLVRLNKIKDQKFSHDNLFHTLLGLFEVKTKIYKEDLDILKNDLTQIINSI